MALLHAARDAAPTTPRSPRPRRFNGALVSPGVGLVAAVAAVVAVVQLDGAWRLLALALLPLVAYGLRPERHREGAELFRYALAHGRTSAAAVSLVTALVLGVLVLVVVDPGAPLSVRIVFGVVAGVLALCQVFLLRQLLRWPRSAARIGDAVLHGRGEVVRLGLDRGADARGRLQGLAVELADGTSLVLVARGAMPALQGFVAGRVDVAATDDA